MTEAQTQTKRLIQEAIIFIGLGHPLARTQSINQ